MSGRLRQRQAYLLQDLPTDNGRSPHSNPSRHTGVQQLRVIATGVRVNCSVEYILSTSGGRSKIRCFYAFKGYRGVVGWRHDCILAWISSFVPGGLGYPVLFSFPFLLYSYPQRPVRSCGLATCLLLLSALPSTEKVRGIRASLHGAHQLNQHLSLR
jgi:hypothetical protein